MTYLILFILSGLAFSLPVHAHYYDYARVIDATTVYSYTEIQQPVRRCRPSITQARITKGGSVKGAIVGGLIGHSLGDDAPSRLVGTVAGASLGSALGRQVSGKSYYTKIHCEMAGYRSKQKRHLDGYQVTYRYKGHHYSQFMQHYPGKRIKVKVSAVH
jgi:uncharacterized protein YcfJ